MPEAPTGALSSPVSSAADMVLIEPDLVSDTCMEPDDVDCAMLLGADIHHVASSATGTYPGKHQIALQTC